jgi:hypothetical protein
MNHQNFISNITEISDNLFEMWLSDERSKRLEQDLIDLFWYDFEEGSFNLDYEEFIETNNTEISKDMYFENCFKEKAKEWFYDRYNEIIYDFNQNLDIVDSSHIRIYRVISVLEKDYSTFLDNVKNLDLFKNYNGIGKYWSYDENSAEAHWNEHISAGGYKEVLVKAIIPFSLININLTILLNLDTNLGEMEKEIRLNEGDLIFIESIDDIEINAPYIV